jgi:hypothetical protein
VTWNTNSGLSRIAGRGPGWALATATIDRTAMNGAMKAPIARSPDVSST